MNEKVSIVICTYNRAPFLNRTLHSLKRLAYKEFEVIVVNGPSTDNTDEVIDLYKNAVKVVKNPLANLSISRNMGIQYSSGDIVAFIDDDAIPDEHWLNDILSVYQNDSLIGGAGGRVFGPGNNHFQFENGYVNYWGESEGHDLLADYNDADGEKYNMMLGTNCTFKRSVLEEVGGFDEYYDYFHDESDLCLRVVRAGYKIINHEEAYIHHEYAKSNIRQDTYDGCRLNWYPIIKNQIYFAIKNSIGFASEHQQKQKILEIKKKHISNFKQWKKENRLTAEECERYIQLCESAYLAGSNAGFFKERKLNLDLGIRTEFKKFHSDLCEPILSIGLICRDNPSTQMGGIAKYTDELANGFVVANQIVHVFTEGNEKEDWILDWMENGICYHKVNINNDYFITEKLKEYPTTCSTLSYAYSVYKSVERVLDVYLIDILETPLWNFEGSVLAHLYKDKLPVLTRIETPLLKVIETQKWIMTDDLKLFSDFEKELLKDSFGIISISEHIKETIGSLYNIDFERLNTKKIFLGVESPGLKKEVDDEKFVILTVGRLERRKGIHTIFEVIPDILKKYTNVEFHFIGDNLAKDAILQMPFEEEFNKKYCAEQWYDRVKFLGKVTNDIKNREYANCNLVIAPSLYESFGLMLLEAMSYGKPVIASRIGGMQEIVLENETGFLIDVENSKQLKNYIETLINDKKLLMDMGEAAINRYHKEFSSTIMIRNSLYFYEECLQKFKKESVKFKNEL